MAYALPTPSMDVDDVVNYEARRNTVAGQPGQKKGYGTPQKTFDQFVPKSRSAV